MAKFTMIPVLSGDSVEETPVISTPRRVAPVVQQPSVEPIPLGWWANRQRQWNRNALKRNVARIINICKDHEANDVKSGDPVYVELHRSGGRALRQVLPEVGREPQDSRSSASCAS